MNGLDCHLWDSRSSGSRESRRDESLERNVEHVHLHEDIIYVFLISLASGGFRENPISPQGAQASSLP